MNKLKSLIKSGVTGVTENGDKFTVLYLSGSKYNILFEDGRIVHLSSWDSELSAKSEGDANPVNDDIILLIDPNAIPDTVKENISGIWDDCLFDETQVDTAIIWKYESAAVDEIVTPEPTPTISVEFDVKINGKQIDFDNINEQEKAVLVTFYLKLMQDYDLQPFKDSPNKSYDDYDGDND